MSHLQPLPQRPYVGISHRRSLQFKSNSPNITPLGQKVMIVTDSWDTISGVRTTVNNLIDTLKAQNYKVSVVHTGQFKSIPSSYPGLRLANPLGLKKKVAQKIESENPNRMFIVTEGPLGWAARNYCLKNGIPFSTNYTTKWPEYMKAHYKIPTSLSYRIIKHFHDKAQAVLVTTPSLLEDLKQRGFKNLFLWTRAVDTKRFSILSETERQAFITQQGLANRARPFYLYVGRVSTEKNIETFLKSDLPGTKIVVGPEGAHMSLDKLRQDYPDVVFTGPKTGKELTDFYGSSDVFVFPSKTDTFGLVMLEALASGLPVVGFNVTGPKDVLGQNSQVGFLANHDTEFQQKALQAWHALQSGTITRQACREYALPFSWEECAKKLLSYLKVFQFPKTN